MRICAGLLQVYLRSHMGFSQDIMRPAHQAGCFEQFKMSGMLIQVTARSPIMAVTVVSPGLYNCRFDPQSGNLIQNLPIDEVILHLE